MAIVSKPEHPSAIVPILAPQSSKKLSQVPAKEGPDHRYQVAEQLLYEREFHGHTYVSAHLSRLQHGQYVHDNIHGPQPHVTFVAVTFCLHPCLSVTNRFQSAVINIHARRADPDKKETHLRFIKYAPHLAYGRMSSESLKWTFQLGASLGTTSGPVSVSTNTNGTYERDEVIGTMMKIQGSTRSETIDGSILDRSLTRDRKLVWSLEENAQQHSGLPREFTFVFLIETPPPTRKSWSGSSDAKDSSTWTTNGASSPPDTFMPFRIGISVIPEITSAPLQNLYLMGHDELQWTTLRDPVGQKFPTSTTDPVTGSTIGKADVEPGLYNFANVLDFESLVEMPGNVVTSKVCEMILDVRKYG